MDAAPSVGSRVLPASIRHTDTFVHEKKTAAELTCRVLGHVPGRLLIDSTTKTKQQLVPNPLPSLWHLSSAFGYSKRFLLSQPSWQRDPPLSQLEH